MKRHAWPVAWSLASAVALVALPSFAQNRGAGLFAGTYSLTSYTTVTVTSPISTTEDRTTHERLEVRGGSGSDVVFNVTNNHGDRCVLQGNLSGPSSVTFTPGQRCEMTDTVRNLRMNLTLRRGGGTLAGSRLSLSLAWGVETNAGFLAVQGTASQRTTGNRTGGGPAVAASEPSPAPVPVAAPSPTPPILGGSPSGPGVQIASVSPSETARTSSRRSRRSRASRSSASSASAPSSSSASSPSIITEPPEPPATTAAVPLWGAPSSTATPGAAPTITPGIASADTPGLTPAPTAPTPSPGTSPWTNSPVALGTPPGAAPSAPVAPAMPPGAGPTAWTSAPAPGAWGAPPAAPAMPPPNGPPWASTPATGPVLGAPPNNAYPAAPSTPGSPGLVFMGGAPSGYPTAPALPSYPTPAAPGAYPYPNTIGGAPTGWTQPAPTPAPYAYPAPQPTPRAPAVPAAPATTPPPGTASRPVVIFGVPPGGTTF